MDAYTRQDEFNGAMHALDGALESLNAAANVVLPLIDSDNRITLLEQLIALNHHAIACYADMERNRLLSGPYA